MKAAVSTMGQPFSINSVEYRGVINELKQSQRILIGGFDLTLTASICVAKADIPTPVIGSKVTANGKVRRIVAVDEDQITYTLHLDEVNR